jgi:dipeptidyl aminopeptidase/acylaminoacyl peptidase
MLVRRAFAALMTVTGLLTVGYVGISSYIAEQLVYDTPKPIVRTPASLGLRFASVTVLSRDDHINLKGWFIPGVLPDGRLTVDRVIVVVHGTRTNRESPGDHLLELTAALARHGFGVLSFDMRGMGESPPAPLAMGNLEQRDVLGAVDFLRIGHLPFPELGRPRIIGGLGISMGAATLLLAAAREPAIRAVVSDSAYADAAPLLEREIPKRTVAVVGRIPGVFAPSALVMARILYGVDLFAARPVDTIARIAPRPLLLIHGTADDYVPISNFQQLDAAATATAGAQVTTWVVPNARHAQAFKNTGSAYVARVAAFFDAGLGADRSSSGAGA